MKPLKIVLCGAAGRMGLQVAALIAGDERFALVAGIDRSAGPSWKTPDSLPGALGQADALVDFSSPESSIAFVTEAARAGKPAVVGTTGFTKEQSERLKAAGKAIALLVSPNMSPGMNLMYELVSRAAASLPRYDAAVTESHHTMKKDAPSGSAKRLVEAVQAGRKSDVPVPALSIRAGDIVGDHSVLFAGPGERLELSHRAHSREVFARGALEAALWLRGRKPGAYTMRDFLGLS